MRRHRDRFANDFLSFTLPFDDSRAQLADRFDELFDSVEAILAEDRNHYAAALDSFDNPGAGRLLGSQYLIPLPHYGRYLGTFDQQLKVVVINADYSPTSGPERIHRDTRGDDYQLGEVI
ncbi:hypothetical protein ACQPZ2_22550 [Nocardia pseudovaccinii]|uniref:hypothetical protein n=1 Tax=Nocardia pseudovaccinii TaxID=189540 RepID=UPI003D909B90